MMRDTNTKFQMVSSTDKPVTVMHVDVNWTEDASRAGEVSLPARLRGRFRLGCV
jgi:hypothetical protein